MANFDVKFENAQTIDVSFSEDSFNCDLEPGIPVGNYSGSYSVNPTEETQTLPTQFKVLDENIQVNAIPEDYIGSGVIRRSEGDLTALNDTITAPSGYYPETVSKAVAHGSAKSAEGTVTVNPILSVDNEGVITAENNKDITLTPTVVPGYISSGTPGVITAKGNTVYQMIKRTSDDLTVNGQTVTAPDGYYPENATKTVPIILKPTVLRPDAQLVQSFTYDKYINADEEITIPGYSTTAQTLKASANLTPTVSVDPATETFFIIEKFLTIPEYNITTKAKGRAEYTYCVYLYELARIPANLVETIDKSKAITSATNIIGTMTSYRLLYWSSASAISLYASNGYGCYQTPTAPTISGTTLTIKSPALAVRGSTSYFTSTFMNALTDIRYQYAIDVYKAPKEALGIDGWITNSVVNHVLECANSTTHKLT